MVGLKFLVLLSQIMEDDVNDPDFLTHQRESLAAAVREQRNRADFQPLNISPWLAMSLMQKAIRRREPKIALRVYRHGIQVGLGNGRLRLGQMGS
jgi:hypothetical protein